MDNRIICFLWPNFKYLTTTAGNQIVKDPSFLKNIENCVMKLKYETSYFCDIDGNRTMIFFGFTKCRYMPAIVEPLFQGYEANVEVHLAMYLDDLKNVISKIQNRYL